jgi:putative Holliday junction resolvase
MISRDVGVLENMMSRLMGVDYGSKRIGIAITDITRVVAIPFDTIKSVSLKKNAFKIVEIAKNNDVSIIVFGLPINMNGAEGVMTEIVRSVIYKIKSFSNINIVTVDERLTTLQIEKMLIDEANVSRKKRKKLRDKIAAAIILRAYLDTHPVV